MPIVFSMRRKLRSLFAATEPGKRRVNECDVKPRNKFADCAPGVVCDLGIQRCHSLTVASSGDLAVQVDRCECSSELDFPKMLRSALEQRTGEIVETWYIIKSATGASAVHS